jgi:nuclear cap-binding protein subunit 1
VYNILLDLTPDWQSDQLISASLHYLTSSTTMADFDRRPRRGGGGHFNNRKRRYRGKERIQFQDLTLTHGLEDEYNDRQPQRRRYEEPLAITIRKAVLSIAESPVRRVEDDVPYIAKSIADNYFDSDLTSGFLDLVVQMYVAAIRHMDRLTP